MTKSTIWLGTSAVIALITALGIVYLFPPASSSFYPKCIFYQATGLHCPGCGGFRATHLILHGHILEALHMNVMATLFLPSLAGILILQRFFWKTTPSILHLRASPRVYWSIVVGISAFWILRNIPLWPCTYLAPY